MISKDFVESLKSSPEFIAVANNLKPVTRINSKLKNYEKIMNFCVSNNLFSKHSDFGIDVFGHKIRTVNITNDETEIYVYISQSEKMLKKAILYDRKNHEVRDENGFSILSAKYNQKLGEILGYPSCCLHFFSHVRKYHAANYAIEAFKNTSGNPSFLANRVQISDDFNFNLISHYPCSFDCKPTRKYARELLRKIEDRNSSYAKKIKLHLKLPVLYYDIGRGVRFIGSEFINKNEMFYGRTFSSTMDDIFTKSVEKGNRILIYPNQIIVFKNETLIHILDKKNEYNGILIRFE